MTPAIFGITNGVLNTIVSLLLLSLVAIWLSLIYWTYEDARRRIEDPTLIWIFTAWSLFPFVGTIIYTIIRPPEYLEDVREREVETRSAEVRLHMIQNRTCPGCGYEVESDYLRCPSCLRRLKEPCESCGKPLDPRWRVCPFCETENKRAVAARPAAARSRTRTARAPEREERPARSASAERSTARRTKREADAASAAERQRRSLASVRPDSEAPEKPEAAQTERISAASAIAPKRGETAEQSAVPADKKAAAKEPAKRPARRTTSRKTTSKRSKS